MTHNKSFHAVLVVVGLFLLIMFVVSNAAAITAAGVAVLTVAGKVAVIIGATAGFVKTGIMASGLI